MPQRIWIKNSLIGLIVGLLAGGAIVALILWFIMKPRTDAAYEQLNRDSAEVRRSAEKDAQALIKAAQSEAKANRMETDKVIKQRFKDLSRTEERVDSRQANLDNQLQRIENREQNLNKRQSKMDRQKNTLDQMQSERLGELERVAGMTTEEAKQHLLSAAKL